jgi:hypothetical protein
VSRRIVRRREDDPLVRTLSSIMKSARMMLLSQWNTMFLSGMKGKYFLSQTYFAGKEFGWSMAADVTKTSYFSVRRLTTVWLPSIKQI